MALVKSKQIQSLVADKVTTSSTKQFVSDVEKTTYLDKYTKAEADTVKTALETKIATDVSAVDTKANGIQTQLNTDVATLNAAIGAATSNLQTQITNSLAGLTWKAPVADFASIATSYPTPEEGWMVTVADTDKVYRYDAILATWSEFPIQISTTYSRAIALVPSNAQTVISTGIKNDGTGVYKSIHSEIILTVNGFTQQPGAGLDYTTAFVDHELIITWLNRGFALDTDDEMLITYTHFDVV